MAEKVQVNADKLKVLNAVMEKIEKDFGKGSIMRMNSQEVNDVPVIPTGSITLDMALGVGGYPKGRVVEIYGPESSGKTTLAIHAIAEAQKAGGIAALKAVRNLLVAPTADVFFNKGDHIANLHAARDDAKARHQEIFLRHRERVF